MTLAHNAPKANKKCGLSCRVETMGCASWIQGTSTVFHVAYKHSSQLPHLTELFKEFTSVLACSLCSFQQSFILHIAVCPHNVTKRSRYGCIDGVHGITIPNDWNDLLPWSKRHISQGRLCRLPLLRIQIPMEVEELVEETAQAQAVPPNIQPPPPPPKK